MRKCTAHAAAQDFVSERTMATLEARKEMTDFVMRSSTDFEFLEGDRLQEEMDEWVRGV